MIRTIISLLLKQDIDELAARAVAKAGKAAAPVIRRLAIGASLIAAGIFLLALGVIGLLASTFIAIAGLPFVPAALTTTALFFVLAVIVSFIGLRVLAGSRKRWR